MQLENCAIKSKKALINQGLSRRHFSVANGGDGRDRTDDLHTASVALSQLSYAPISSHTVDFIAFRHAFYIQLFNAVRGSLPVGLRSQLSYAPICSQTVDTTPFRYAFYIQLFNAFRGSLPVGLLSQLSYTPV